MSEAFHESQNGYYERVKGLFARTSIKRIRNLYCTNLNKDNSYAQ
jgi:hypothetical protein